MKKLFQLAFVVCTALFAHAQPCSDLFISEYVEGTSNNKAIEIYNPTSDSVSLTGYKLQLFPNGSATANTTLNLAGKIAAGDVYVVVNSQASAGIKATRDTSSGVTAFNGDDAIALVNGTTIIDVIGQIGVDPGTNWSVDTGSTLNHTLVRKISVQQGDTNWTVGATEWDVYKQDTFFLGAHTMTSCGTPVDTVVRFSSNSTSVPENAGTVNVSLVLNQSASSDKTVDVELLSGDAVDIGNYSTQSVTILANSTSQAFAITVTDDTLAEGSEQFVFRITNPSSGLLIGTDFLYTLTITDNDSIAPPPPYYPIGTVSSVDTAGVIDSNGVHCILSGIVYGVNMRAIGLQFTIHDNTGGVGVFSSSKNFGYSVHEGDSVVVIGIVEQFNGFTQIGTLDTVYPVGTGTLLQSTNTTVLDESAESELIRINGVHLVDAGQWDNSSPSGFSVDVTNGSQTFSMRVDEQVDLYNQSAPTSSFDVIGLGGQFDNSSPFDSGYQISPRYSADLILHTGIFEKNLDNDLEIYPNPSNGVFNILNVNSTGNKATIKLIDMTGKVVFRNEYLAEKSGVITMELTQAPGIYFVQIGSESSITIGKICIIPPK